MTIIDEAFLDARLAELEDAAHWSPRTISKFETFIRTAEDHQLFKVDPLEFGRERGLKEKEACDLFLHATRSGIFDIQWGLVCPLCGDTVESFATLRKVNSHFHCTICAQDTVAALDDYIMISFLISPRVRRIAYHDPDSLNLIDYWQKYRFNRQWRLKNGAPVSSMFLEGLKTLQAAEPGATVDFDLTLEPGLLKIFNLRDETVLNLDVGAEAGLPAALLLEDDGAGPVASVPAVATGPVRIRLVNHGGRRLPLAISQVDADPDLHGVDIAPFFTAKQLLNSQTFRNLFSSEVILATDGIGIKELTLLFTDLKGSTAMYDRIGDLQAFSLVRQHFESLTRVVVQHHGAIVKTIGDAVMATFLNPLDGLNAAVRMLQEIDAFNGSRASPDLILKVGLHHGAAIAVTLNERLDYFGQTVNIAARVQGLADADEIYITREVFEHPGVGERLAGLEVTPEQSRLKGISDTVSVFRVREPG